MERLVTVKDMSERYGCSMKTARAYLRRMFHYENPLAAPMWAVAEWEESRGRFPDGKRTYKKNGGAHDRSEKEGLTMNRSECENLIAGLFRVLIKVYKWYNPDGKYLCLSYINDAGDEYITFHNRHWEPDEDHPVTDHDRPIDYSDWEGKKHECVAD